MCLVDFVFAVWLVLGCLGLVLFCLFVGCLLVLTEVGVLGFAVISGWLIWCVAVFGWI